MKVKNYKGWGNDLDFQAHTIGTSYLQVFKYQKVMQQPSTLIDGCYLKVVDSPSAKTIKEINAINQHIQ